MNQIEYKVRSARRRLMLAQFGRALCYWAFAGLIVAIVACAVPAFYPMDVDMQTWKLSWIIGSLGVAVVGATIYTFIAAPAVNRVATEVDHRFGLHERISSSMSLGQKELDSDFGLALMTDAEKRASDLQIRDQFELKPSKLGWLPLALAPILAIVFLLAEPAKESLAESEKVDPEMVAQVKRAAAQLKKRIQQQKRKADATGLEDAKELFNKLESELDKLQAKKSLTRKEAMISLNDLKKQLEERRKEVGSSEEMRKAMSGLKGLQGGPAEKVASAMEKGEFGKARDIVKDLAQKLKNGQLSKKEQEQLKKQVEEMKRQMAKAAEDHEKAKKDLQKQIDQARSEGRNEDAAKMQKQMDQMQQRDQQMQQMQKMAQALNDAAQAMQNGDSQQAADALQQMADELGDMQDQMSELQDLESALNDLEASKEQMRGDGSGQGQNGQNGDPFGMGNGFGDGFGQGLGQGQGSGDRPEEEEDTNSYETQVRGNVKKGRARLAGFADGPNRKGITREELKALMEGGVAEESNPLENQNLPRTEQEHAKDYFDKLREGQ